MRIAAHFPDKIFTVSSCHLSYGDRRHDAALFLQRAPGIGPAVKEKRAT
jgi:hypothetical protein